MREFVSRWWRVSRAWLVAVLLVVLAGCMTLVLAVVPAAVAADPTYTGADDFVAGYKPLAPGDAGYGSHPVKLTVKKMLTTVSGSKATGSAVNDKPDSSANQPGKGVSFTLTKVTPTGDPGDMKAPTSANPAGSGYTVPAGSPVYVGKTDADGVIANLAANAKPASGVGYWYLKGDASAVPVEKFADTGHYLLQEDDSADNPYLHPKNPLFDPTYTRAEASIFDLPYRATNTVTDAAGNKTSVNGFVYNVTVYPKNVNQAQLSKRVVRVRDQSNVEKTDAAGNPIKYAQVGDKVVWEITQKLYDGNSAPGSLNLSDIRAVTDATQPILTIVDRHPSRYIVANSDIPSFSFSFKDNGVPTTISSPPTSPTNPSPISPVNPVNEDQSLDADGNRPRFSAAGSADKKILPAAGSPFLRLQNENFANWGRAFTWKNTDPSSNLGNLFGHYQAGHTYTDIELKIGYTSYLMWKGATYGGVHTSDSDAAPAGHLFNMVGSDHIDNAGLEPNRAIALLSSPGAQVVKTNLVDSKVTSLKGIPGAVFRLTKPGTNDEFLCEDGKFYKEKDASGNVIIVSEGTALTAGKHYAIQAQSNDNGIVSFVGIPLVDPATDRVTSDVDALKFDLLEYQAPTYKNPANPSGPELEYRKPSYAFERVDFSKYAGKTRQELADSPGVIGTVKGIDGMNYTDYETKHMTDSAGNPVFTNMKGDGVTLGVVNWQQDQEDPAKVGSIPLTGGKGILMMLFVGLLIMLAGTQMMKARAVPAEPAGRHSRTE